MATWDIITGSKGGVGKTLFSLMLLARYLQADKIALVVDLNSMNTDFARILLRTGALRTARVFISDDRFNVYHLRFLVGGRARHCIVMSPDNPFQVITPEIFADTLVAIKNARANIKQHLEIEQVAEVEHVIIDTNYHFCNIFHRMNTDGNYDVYQRDGVLHNDQFYIWFLWVAAQLEALLPHVPHNDGERVAVTSTAATIERNVPNSNNTPFIHVFNPYVLNDAPTPPAAHPIWNRMSGTIGNVMNAIHNINNAPLPNLTIPQYAALAERAMGPNITFRQWLDTLIAVWNNIPNGNQLDGRVRFGQSIIDAIGNVRNANIFPLATIHKNFAGYTDRTTEVNFDALIVCQLYNEFNMLMGKYRR